MRLMNTNFFSQTAIVINSLSKNSNFPVSNLKHPFRSKRWRSTDVTSEWVKFDMVTSEEIDSVVLLWPKEDGIRLSNSAVIRIQANATNVWTSPAVDQALSISNDYLMASYYFSTAQNYRYWRLVIEDPGNPYGFLELGVIWLGKSLAVENAQNGFKFDLVDTSKRTSTDFGHEYVDVYPQVAKLDFSYQNMDYVAIQTLENAFRINGFSNPVLVLIDPEEALFNKDHFAIYGKFRNSFGIQHVRRDILNTDSISVLELS